MATEIIRDKSTNPKTALLTQIRKLMGTGRGPSNFLAGLDDRLLQGVFTLIRQGEASRAVARWLHRRGIGLDSSEDSLSRGINKFRHRIAPLLVGPSVPEAAGPKASSPFPQALRPSREPSDLENVNELVRRYDSVIKAELAHAEAGGALSPNLARHVAALSGLLKTKERVEENARKPGSDFTPEESRELQEVMGNLVSRLPDRGAVFIEGARRYVQLVKENAITLEVRPDGTFVGDDGEGEPDHKPEGEDDQPEWAKYLP